MKRLFEYNEEQLPLAIFEDITQIPRPSGGEERIAAYLAERGRRQGFEAEMDPVSRNVIVRVPATEGYEDSEPVILQAHTDMVCEKTPDSDHDFCSDPIRLILEGDSLRADQTTLGADDGIGVALAFAAAESEAAQHPPLELLLTSEEETTFLGAGSVNADSLKGRRMINLDNASENQIILGSMGGTAVGLHLPVQKTKAVPEDGMAFEIVISGMHGGHSGEDVHRGYGSANQLLIRLLRKLERQHQVSLAEIQGGSFRLALPRDSRAVILTRDDVAETVNNMKADFLQEYQKMCPDLSIQLNAAGARGQKYTSEDFHRILALLSVHPDGIMQMNGVFPGVVESCLNLGYIEERDRELYLETEVRGDYPSTIDDIVEKIACLAELTGASWETFDSYSPWSYDPESALREKAVAVYRELFGRDMTRVMMQGGLECGILKETIPDLDVISFGPDCRDFHSPRECLSVSSAKRTWVYLKELLTALK